MQTDRHRRGALRCVLPSQGHRRATYRSNAATSAVSHDVCGQVFSVTCKKAVHMSCKQLQSLKMSSPVTITEWFQRQWAACIIIIIINIVPLENTTYFITECVTILLRRSFLSRRMRPRDSLGRAWVKTTWLNIFYNLHELSPELLCRCIGCIIILTIILCSWSISFL